MVLEVSRIADFLRGLGRGISVGVPTLDFSGKFASGRPVKVSHCDDFSGELRAAGRPCRRTYPISQSVCRLCG